jgi:tetratricopeptide (TPR) repeat protein
LRRAAEHAVGGAEETETILRFGAALRRYWSTRSRDEEALALLRPALDRPRAQADPALFAPALITAAWAARYVDITAARRLAEQAVNLTRQLGNSRLLIESLAAISAVYYHVGDPQRGLLPGQEAIELARRLGDDVLLGESLVSYLWCDALIDPAHAGPLFTEAIACTQRSGDHLYVSYVNNLAGLHALRAGDLAAARAYLQQAAQSIRIIGDEDGRVSVNMGWVLRQNDDPGGARSSFEQALRISRRNGDRYGIAYCSLGLACVATDAEDWNRAAVLHGIAQAFLDPTGQPWEELEARYRQDSLGRVRAQLGQEQFDLARAKGLTLSLDQALDVASGKALAA